MRFRFLGMATAIVMMFALTASPAQADPIPALNSRDILFSADPLPKDPIDPGTELTVGGTLRGRLNGTVQPLVGWTVSIRKDSPDGSSEPLLAAATTDANGYFSATLTFRSSTRLSITVPGIDDSGDPTTISVRTGLVQVRKSLNIKIKEFDYSPWGVLSISESHTLSSLTAGPLHLEYSPNGRTGWKTVRKWSAKFTRRAKINYSVSGYWRFHHLGTKDLVESSSEVKKAWRWNTHFTDFKVAPKKVRFKSRTTVSGRLWTYYSKTKKKPYTNRRVQLLFNCKKTGKSKEWFSEFGFVRTDSKGRFRKSVKAVCTGQVIAVFWGASGRFAAESARAPLTVTGSAYRLPRSSLSTESLPR